MTFNIWYVSKTGKPKTHAVLRCKKKGCKNFRVVGNEDGKTLIAEHCEDHLIEDKTKK